MSHCRSRRRRGGILICRNDRTTEVGDHCRRDCADAYSQESTPRSSHSDVSIASVRTELRSHLAESTWKFDSVCCRSQQDKSTILVPCSVYLYRNRAEGGCPSKLTQAELASRPRLRRGARAFPQWSASTSPGRRLRP